MIRKLELTRETLKQLRLENLDEAQQAMVAGGNGSGTCFFTSITTSRGAFWCATR